MSKSNKPRIGITMGDPGGIGPEVISKSLQNTSIQNIAQYHLIGDAVVFDHYFHHNHDFHLTDCHNDLAEHWVKGTTNAHHATAALNYLNKAVQLVKDNVIDAIVTGPVCKESIAELDQTFQGHTEFFAQKANLSDSNVGMMFVTDCLKTIIVTRHMALKDVPKHLSITLIDETICLTHQALVQLFGIPDPCIGVCGLNPHAGEGGLLGKEEQTTIIPAIEQAQNRGWNVQGPFAADTLFSPDIGDIGKTYDTIIAMYHDQGLIPIKTLAFHDLVNLTIGLPYVRTSPAHGTAFNLAGKDTADPRSMSAAIQLACQLAS